MAGLELFVDFRIWVQVWVRVRVSVSVVKQKSDDTWEGTCTWK